MATIGGGAGLLCTSMAGAKRLRRVFGKASQRVAAPLTTRPNHTVLRASRPAEVLRVASRHSSTCSPGSAGEVGLPAPLARSRMDGFGSLVKCAQCSKCSRYHVPDAKGRAASPASVLDK